MILSFSVQNMKPMIAAGLRQRAGENIGDDRVKRQTIRQRGSRAEKLLDWAKGAAWTIPYDLHLWWKSRAPDGHLLGVASSQQRPAIRVYPIEILHSTSQIPGEAERECLRIVLPKAWEWHESSSCWMFWGPGDGSTPFSDFARRDGFDSVEAFRDFFVPRRGDRFRGILYRW